MPIALLIRLYILDGRWRASEALASLIIVPCPRKKVDRINLPFTCAKNMSEDAPPTIFSTLPNYFVFWPASAC